MRDSRLTMFARVRQLLEMIRFSHTLFALPFALLAAVMAWYAGAPLGGTASQLILKEHWLTSSQWHPAVSFRWQDLLGIILCMVAARSTAMAFNRIADRDLDAQNPRTRMRHLPSGILTLRSVMVFAATSALLFVGSTLLFLPNWLPLVLAVPVLLFLLAYSYTKRFTLAAHFWLGASLMLAPVAAWIAIRGQIILSHPTDLLPAIVLGGAVLFWVAGFDIIYACQDAEFDRAARLHSIPARLGVVPALRIAAACHAVMIALLALLPVVYPYLGLIYAAAVLAVAVLLIYEHWIVRPDDLTRVNVAFFNVNAIVSIGLFVVTTLDLWMKR